MYNLIGYRPYATHDLQFIIKSLGLSVDSFSFGTCEMPGNVGSLPLDRKPL